MSEPVRILVVEDLETDFKIAEREIRKLLKNCQFVRVQTRSEFLQNLDAFNPDLILSDYSLPQFNGMEALMLAQLYKPVTPFIIWTGSMSEDIAVECMKAGANNYILKDNLKRLAPAVTHALEEGHQIEERLRAEENYQNIFENSPEGIFQSTPEGRYVKLNPAMARIYGYASPQEMLDSITDISSQVYVDPNDRQRFTQLFETNGVVVNLEMRNRRKDGSTIWVSTSARAVRAADGKVLYYEGFSQEITERKLAEEKLRENEERLRIALQLVDLAVFNLDRDLRYTWMYQPQLGYSLDRVIGHTDAELLPAEDASQITAIKQHVLQTGIGAREEVAIHANGEKLIYDLIVEPVIDEGGAVVGLTGATLDITDQKRAELERQAQLEIGEGLSSTNDLPDFMRLIHQAVQKVIRAENFFAIFFNPETGLFEEIYGVDRYDPPATPSKLEKSITSYVFRTGQSVLMDQALFAQLVEQGEVELVGTDSAAWLGVPLKTAHGTLGVIAVQDYDNPDAYSERDREFLTSIGAQVALAIERKQAEDRIHTQEKRFRALIENSLDNISLLGIDGTLLWENPATHRNLGYGQDEFVGRNIFQLMHPDDQVWTSELFSKLVREPGTHQHGTFRLRHHDGSWRWTEAIAANMLDEPSVQAVVINYRDVTERKLAEIELQQKNDDLALINAINEAVIRGEDLASVSSLMARELKRIFSSESSTIYLLSPDGQHVTMQQFFIPAEVRHKIEKIIGSTIPLIQIPIQAGGFFHRMLEAEHGLITSDPDEIRAWMGEFAATTFLPPLARRSVKKLIPQIFDLLQIHSVLIVPLRLDGRLIGFLDVASRNQFSADDLRRIKSLSRQLTAAIQRQQADEKVRRSEEFLQSVQNALSAHLAILDEKGMIVQVNAAWRKFAEQNGYEGTGFGLGRNYLEICDSAQGKNSEVAREAAAAIREVISGGRHEAWVEYPCHSPTEKRWFILRVTKFLDGNQTWAVLAHENVTERKLAEEAFRESSEQFQTLFTASPEAIMLIAPHAEWTIVDCNEAACRMNGYAREELIGQSIDILNLYPEPPTPESRATYLEQVRRTDVLRYETTHRRKDGMVFPVEVSTSLIKLGGQDMVLGMDRDITERKRAEENLRESEERYRVLFEDSPVSIWEEDFSEVKQYLEHLKTQGVTDLRAYFSDHPESLFECASKIKILGVNNAALTLYRAVSKAELIASTLRNLSEGEQEHNLEDFLAIAEGKTGHGWEGKDETLAGEPIEINLRWSVVPGREHDYSRVIVTVTDITARKRAEGELRRSEDRFRLAARATQDVIWDWNLETGQHFWSENALIVFGYAPEEMGRDVEWWKNQIHPDDRGPVLARLNTALQGEVEVWQDEYRFLLRDGTYADIRDRGYIERKPDGHAIRLIGAMSNVSAQKRAERELRESEERYRILIGQLPAIVYTDLPELGIGVTHFVSPQIEHILGFTQEEWMKGGFELWTEQLHPEDRDAVVEQYLKCMQAGEPFQAEYRLRKKDGETLWVLDQSQMLFDAQGRPLSSHGIIYDITERKLAERSLRESEERFSSAFEFAPIGKALVGLDGRWLKVNPALCSIVGYSVEEMMQLTFQDITHPEDLDADLAMVAQLQSGQINSYQMEKRYRHKQGHYIWVLLSVSLIRNDAQEPLYFISQVQDISERRRVEENNRRRLAELEALYENGLAINRLLDPKLISEKIIAVLAQKLNWHHAAVRLYEAKSNQLELTALSHPGLSEAQVQEQMTRIDRLIISPEQGLTGWAVRERLPLRSDFLKNDPRYVETYPGMHSGLYVPILAGDRVLGAISVESEEESAFTEQDERLLMTLANQAAIAIENAQLYLMVQTELGVRQQTESRLRESEENYRLLAEKLEIRVNERTAEVQDLYNNAPCGYHSLDVEGRILRINQTELDWLGYPREEIVGKPFEDFLTEKGRLNFLKSFPRFMEHGSVKDLEFDLRRKDGSTLPVLVSATAIYDQEGRYVSSRSTLFDNTERKFALETLQLANAEMKRALRTKDEFLANMSHELRTPLNAILGLSESLLEQTTGPLNERQQKYLVTVNESGHHLLALINDILDLAKVEAGQITLSPGKVDVKTACQSSLRMIQQLAKKKQQTVEVLIEETIGHVWADERRLKQMIVNLLSNAVKFTPEGGTLGLTAQVDQSTSQLLITVWDHGIGIREEDLPRLFQPFVQLDSSLARESGGTGLGLALVAQMARLHGGSVSVSSQPGRGSRFTIILPWETAVTGDTLEKFKITGRFPKLKRPAGEKQTILIVEDTESVVMVLRDYLELSGFNVEVAQDGMIGVSKALALRPDLILMDVQMPGMDGLEATRRIRQTPGLQETPILALTALAMPSDRQKCIEAGMNDYLSKPVNLKELVKIVQGYLARGRTTR